MSDLTDRVQLAGKARAWVREAIDDKPEGAYEGRFFADEVPIFRYLLELIERSSDTQAQLERREDQVVGYQQSLAQAQADYRRLREAMSAAEDQTDAYRRRLAELGRQLDHVESFRVRLVAMDSGTVFAGDVADELATILARP